MSHIQILTRTGALRFRHRPLQALARWVLEAEGLRADRGTTLNILLTGDRETARLNSTLLGHEGTTDVITFPGLPQPPGPRTDLRDAHLGDVCVNVAIARRVHGRYRTTLEEEVALYVIHGLLHLAGYTDAPPARRRAMHARQRALLRGYLRQAGKLGLLPPEKAAAA